MIFEQFHLAALGAGTLAALGAGTLAALGAGTLAALGAGTLAAFGAGTLTDPHMWGLLFNLRRVWEFRRRINQFKHYKIHLEKSEFQCTRFN
jgi:ornithine cyclodeaminase/alanine dehydrogenase-like protein (mu-crystallin family)